MVIKEFSFLQNRPWIFHQTLQYCVTDIFGMLQFETEYLCTPNNVQFWEIWAKIITQRLSDIQRNLLFSGKDKFHIHFQISHSFPKSDSLVVSIFLTRWGNALSNEVVPNPYINDTSATLVFTCWRIITVRFLTFFYVKKNAWRWQEGKPHHLSPPLDDGAFPAGSYNFSYWKAFFWQ